MASGGPGVSFRSLKDKIKHSAIGETVSGKINSIIKLDHQDSSLPILPDEQGYHFSPGHIRSPSSDSMSSDKESLSSKYSSPGEKWRNGFEMVESAGEVRNAEKAEVFELQLVQLQEQLVSSMIENQNMAAELKAIRTDKQVQNMEKELAKERKRNEELIAKITSLTRLSPSRGSGKEPAVPDSTDTSSAVNESDPTDTEHSEDTKPGWFDSVVYAVLNRYYQLVEDFSVTSEDIEEPEVLEPLSVKMLKHNVKRFGNGVSPVLDMMKSFHLLFNWHMPLLTATVFGIYMYLCWVGLLVPGLLAVLVLRLTLNLLEEMKLIPPITLLPCKKKIEPEKDKDSTSVSDKFNIVLEVATKGQNKFGQLADGLEKAKNLLMWKRAGDTKQIFTPLCGAFIMTLFLKLDTIVFVVGWFLGLKLFVIDPVYNRFPRIKEKYDNTHRLWQNLLTDAQLEKYTQRNANNQMILPRSQQLSKSPTEGVGSRQSSSASLLPSSDTMSEEDRLFCDRFDLPEDERPFPAGPFKGGRHCIHVDKESSVKVSTAFQKHAKLYLTPSFLCYEMVRTDERRAIPLANIVRIEKRKPISFLPGNGMSLEIVEQDSKCRTYSEAFWAETNVTKLSWISAEPIL
ncbi:GRAMD4 [Bugula neritina]|uniref:GRAMD4 n=1 Tax=Bugula neritina TaxID=10212 RepID=A0A7J7JR81_BUGNE|nr:GRAMD4 [Bugula neritina]